MKAKYNMTRKENVFWAKRNLVDYIYHSARLEGCNVTFPDTQTLLDGVNVGSVTLDDVQTILNLRDAWRYVLSRLDAPFDLDYICGINGHVSRNESLQWGVLRTGNVGIGGTDYKPPIPDKDSVALNIEKINIIKNPTERAVDCFLWLCRSQLFWDGNKRTSALAANKILIEAGEGIFTIKEKNIIEFNKLLSQFYTDGNTNIIKQWLYDNCIDGLEEKYIN